LHQDLIENIYQFDLDLAFIYYNLDNYFFII
jgi:hypothetical protein